jgi:transcription elongation factor Elf1
MQGMASAPHRETAARPATPEEVRRVRQTECQRQGHDFTVTTLWQGNAPNIIICERCGDSWKVEADV